MRDYTFYVYNRWGQQKDTIHECVRAIHKDELNGEDSLSITVLDKEITKGDRLVWRDKFGRWHEHVVTETNIIHDGGTVEFNLYCENSIVELMTDYIVERQPSGSAALALARALDGTRWTLGKVEVTTDAQTSWYHISAYEAVRNIIEVWGGEVETEIELSGGIVTERRISIVHRRGGDYGKWFTWGYDLTSIQRKVDSSDVCTALYGYGKGVQVYDESDQWTGGYSRKITFGEINGGLDYVVDEEATQKWGFPDGKGGIKPTFGKVEFDECEDPEKLLQLTLEALKTASKPVMSYTGKVLSLAEGGYASGEDATPGDTVYLRDKVIDERVTGRVLSVSRDLINEYNTEITLGNLAPTLSDTVASTAADLDWIKGHTSGWDAAANLDKSYIDTVIDRWNNVINAEGGWVYWEPGEGITVYDKPINENPMKCIQLKGGAFRIANSRLPNGEWNFRTFGTGDGFTADLLNVGTIVGGSNYWDLESGNLLFKQGTISDTAGNSTWNLTTGKFKAVDIEATGSFTCGTNDNLMKMANGRITGSRYGAETGYIDYTAQFTLTNGVTVRGLYLRSPNLVEIRTDNQLYGKPNTLTNGAYAWSGLDAECTWSTGSSLYASDMGVYAANSTMGMKFLNGGLIATMGF